MLSHSEGLDGYADSLPDGVSSGGVQRLWHVVKDVERAGQRYVADLGPINQQLVDENDNNWLALTFSALESLSVMLTPFQCSRALRL